MDPHIVTQFRLLGLSREDIEIINDRYDVKKFLGEGSFGKVYKAISRRTGELTALKIYDPAYTSSRRHEIELEIRHLRNMTNNCTIPHVECLVEANLDHNYIAKTFITGVDLDAFVVPSRLREKFAKDFIAQLLPTLYLIHNNGYLHRDIKPANIMVDHVFDNFNFWFIDLGLSCYQFDSPNGCSTRGAVGTPLFFTRQLEDAFQRKDVADFHIYERYDVYALGVSLFYSLNDKTDPVGFNLITSAYELPWKHIYSTDVEDITSSLIIDKNLEMIRRRYPFLFAPIEGELIDIDYHQDLMDIDYDRYNEDRMDIDHARDEYEDRMDFNYGRRDEYEDRMDLD